MARHSGPPKYCHHKASGRAVVHINGANIYLPGGYGSPESREAYARVIAEQAARMGAPAVRNRRESDGTVTELCLRYFDHAKNYYQRDGKPTAELASIRESIRPLRALYGTTLARDFSPESLRILRDHMIKEGWSRTTINGRVHRIRRIWRWAVSYGLVSAEQYGQLQAVDSLKKGRSQAREHPPVMPVSDDIVNATLPFLSPTVAAMVQLQRLTGMRSGELVIMRGVDLDTSERVWVYIPPAHKTQHHGHQRPIFLGPKAQAIIRPYLQTETMAYLFSPRQSEALRSQLRREARKSPMTPSQRNRKRKQNARWTPSERYSPTTYRRAVERACNKAFSPPESLDEAALKGWRKAHRWHPHQLRHSAATKLRAAFGIEAAKVVLGHSSLAMTELYAERDMKMAAEIMERIG